MNRIACVVLSCVLTASLLAVVAPSAFGAFHEMRIREVGVGTIADPADEFVELQMYSPGQNFVQNHYLNIHGANGDLDTGFLFPSSPTNGANQQTILIGEANTPGTPDFAPGLNLNPEGGAACYLEMVISGHIDCVSWGTFDNTTPNLPGIGTNVVPAGIPENQSIERSIAAGCPTALDLADDTNNSAADFAVQVTPSPRNNTVAPTETLCVPPVFPTNPTPTSTTPTAKKCKKGQKLRKGKCVKKKRKKKRKKK